MLHHLEFLSRRDDKSDLLRLRPALLVRLRERCLQFSGELRCCFHSDINQFDGSAQGRFDGLLERSLAPNGVCCGSLDSSCYRNFSCDGVASLPVVEMEDLISEEVGFEPGD